LISRQNPWLVDGISSIPTRKVRALEAPVFHPTSHACDVGAPVFHPTSHACDVGAPVFHPTSHACDVGAPAWRAPRASDRYAGHNEYEIPATSRMAVRSTNRQSSVVNRQCSVHAPPPAHAYIPRICVSVPTREMATM
jgi:hypothetical protein